MFDYYDQPSTAEEIIKKEVKLDTISFPAPWEEGVFIKTDRCI